MVIEAVCDRELITKIDQLLAYQRDAPIHVRIVCPRVSKTELIKESITEKIKKLIKFKDALVMLLIDPKYLKKDVAGADLLNNYIKELEDIGVKVHSKRNLHAKIILVENNTEKGLLLMSSNLTHTGLHISKEAGVYFLNEKTYVYDKLKRYVTDFIKESNEAGERLRV